MTAAARLVRHSRRSAGLSQRALAMRAGVPQSTVARVETGQLSPRSDTFEKLLAAAGRSLVAEEKAGYGVDRSQIVELRRLTPTERIRLLTGDAAALRDLDRLRARRR